jgi:phosphoglycerate dehydrogenase-like enzyme
MKHVVWCNYLFLPAARELFETGLRRHRLVYAEDATRMVLVPGGCDPALAEADVAFGQPDVADVMRLPRLRWVALSSAGYTRYDRDDVRTALRQRGAVMTNTSTVFASPCAEHLLAMMLALNRRLPRWEEEQRTTRSWGYLEGRYQVGLLEGQTVVLLGFGAIGRRLADLLAPFRGRIIAVRSRPDGAAPGVEVVGEADLLRVLPLADHVVNVLPARPSTDGFMNTARFAAMRPGARFYNIGRGTTVDQAALMAALRSGQLGGAYLDVMDPEPLPPDHPLWTTPNCHLTPHVGGGHREQDENLARHFLANLARFERGEPLVDRIV